MCYCDRFGETEERMVDCFTSHGRSQALEPAGFGKTVTGRRLDAPNMSSPFDMLSCGYIGSGIVSEGMYLVEKYELELECYTLAGAWKLNASVSMWKLLCSAILL